MAKYTFKCSKCETVLQAYVPPRVKKIQCKECEAGSEEESMVRQMPILGGQEVLETIDDLTGTKWKQDHKNLTRERSEDYYWSVEVPRMVESGTYIEETMLEQGWIFYDEKGHMQINTKPPGKR